MENLFVTILKWIIKRLYANHTHVNTNLFDVEKALLA